MSLDFWIGLGIGSFGVSFLLIKGLKRHIGNVTTLRLAKQEAEESKQALREMVARVYHKDIFPETRRAIGIFRLIKLLLTETVPDIEMAEKPEHYRYITLIKKNVEECLILAQKGEEETSTLSDRFHKIIKQYEDLQE